MGDLRSVRRSAVHPKGSGPVFVDRRSVVFELTERAYLPSESAHTTRIAGDVDIHTLMDTQAKRQLGNP